tara:strand:- start:1399 stop:1935 length:537 start_codon:yes stop_codon:yes gene_type:complete
LIEVVSGLFPDWLVDQTAQKLSEYPIRWTNSPYACYDKARFFGTMVVRNGEFIGAEDSWFIKYFNAMMEHRLQAHTLRTLLNVQFNNMDSQIHNDGDVNSLVSVVYHVAGTDGDTVFYNSANEEIKRVPFNMGQAIIFPSHIYHMGLPPKSGIRVTLGSIYDVADQQVAQDTTLRLVA